MNLELKNSKKNNITEAIKVPIVIFHEKGVLPYSLKEVLYTFVDEDYYPQLEYGLTEIKTIDYMESYYTKHPDELFSSSIDSDKGEKESKKTDQEKEEKYAKTILVKKLNLKKCLPFIYSTISKRDLTQQSTIRSFDNENKIVVYISGFLNYDIITKNNNYSRFISANPFQIEKLSDKTTQYHNIITVNYLDDYSKFSSSLNLIKKIRVSSNKNQHFHNKLNNALFLRRLQKEDKRPEKHYRLLDTYDEFNKNMKNSKEKKNQFQIDITSNIDDTDNDLFIQSEDTNTNSEL